MEQLLQLRSVVDVPAVSMYVPAAHVRCDRQKDPVLLGWYCVLGSQAEHATAGLETVRVPALQ